MVTFYSPISGCMGGEKCFLPSTCSGSETVRTCATMVTFYKQKEARTKKLSL